MEQADFYPDDFYPSLCVFLHRFSRAKSLYSAYISNVNFKFQTNGKVLKVAQMIQHFAYAQYLEMIPEAAGYLNNLVSFDGYNDNDDVDG